MCKENLLESLLIFLTEKLNKSEMLILISTLVVDGLFVRDLIHPLFDGLCLMLKYHWHITPEYAWTSFNKEAELSEEASC